MLAGVRKILIISTLGGLAKLSRAAWRRQPIGYPTDLAEQPSLDGLSQAFIIGEEFIGKDSCCLILDDNIFTAGTSPITCSRQ
ncbi:glycosyltransferase family protein [Pseudomonas chlororaphis]